MDEGTEAAERERAAVERKKARAKERLVRWQGITREHFSSVSNLVLGLATGMLAFLVKTPSDLKTTDGCLLALSVTSLVLLASSVAVAISCAYNRLRDFRKTAQIARQRSNGEPVPTGDRLEAKVLGEISWRLFGWQLGLFASGVLGVTLLMIFRLFY